MTIIQTVIASISGGTTVPPVIAVDPGGIDLNPYNGLRNSGAVRRDYNQGYFNDDLSWFTGKTPSATSYPDVVDIYEELNSPINIDNYSIEWTGYFTPATTGTYIFRTTSDDSSWFWIGTSALEMTANNPNVNNSGAHGPNTVNGTPVALTGGWYYPFRVMYGEAGGGATMRLEYSTDNGNSWNAMSNMTYINTTDDGFLPLVTNGLTYHLDIGNSSSYSGTGSTVSDLAGSSLGDTTLYNTPTYVSNGTGSYLTFDGDTQYAFTPNLVSAFNNPDNIAVSLEVWVRSTSDEGCILVEEGTGSIDGGWYFSAMEIYNTYAWGRLWETGNVNFGIFPRSQWNHLVMTFDGSTIAGYLNGVQITSFPSSRDVPWHHSYGYYYALMANTATNMGGGQPGAGSKLAGDLAQFRIYNKAINASEVAHNFISTKARYGL